MLRIIVFCLWIAASQNAIAETVLFEDHFDGSMQAGWTWLRQDRDAWRLNNQGLEIRVQPGNMWGAANDARNVLLCPVPDAGQGMIEVAVVVTNAPTEQYEQIDLVWYYTDSFMVKIGLELVDGQLSIVMGREEKDRTRTIKIVPVSSHRVALRLRVEADQIEGAFRTMDDEKWMTVGSCDLPQLEGTSPQVSLQAYQGPRETAHSARIEDVRICRLKAEDAD